MPQPKNTPNNPLLQFAHSKTRREHRKQKWANSLYKRLTKRALPLFLRPTDQISTPAILDGVYEPETKQLLDHLAHIGHNHFLLDIGANIGLSSCQSGQHYNEVHLFEPNPNCLHILHVNARIALRDQPYHIHEYALGTQKETLQLYVPAHNWGGAFIKSADNEYDDALLAGKDRYSAFDPKNYDIFDVQVEPATEKLGQLFNDLHARGARQGTIKIDVEGYEKQVLTAIATALPPSLSTYIVFENWKDGLDLSDVLAQTPAQAQLYQLNEHKPGFFSGLRSRTTLLPVDTANAAGNYVLHLHHA